jgi:hypothetical protein
VAAIEWPAGKQKTATSSSTVQGRKAEKHFMIYSFGRVFSRKKGKALTPVIG